MAKRSLDSARRTDSQPQLVEAAKFLRSLLPGSAGSSESDSARRGRLERALEDFDKDRPSAARELGLGALDAFKKLSEAQRRRQAEVDVAILFTDLVDFSSWALKAGDEQALELLRAVESAEQSAVSERGGVVVKRLGDGAMSVFSAAGDAVRAALEAQRLAGKIKVGGHRPELRAGVHCGRPRKVRGGDYLGVDVNIAARVGDAAVGGEVLVSDAAKEELDSAGFKLGKQRKLSAPGAPEDLCVYAVRSKRLPGSAGAKAG